MSASEQAVRFVVSGRVQGVSFRFFTRRLAAELGLRGTVRNLADGTVEAVAVGPPSALERLAAGLARGPAGARVDGVVRQPLPAPPAVEGFDIVY